jgi:succinate dehydrogenase/fumarate reductase-like Fe-S protein
MELITKNWIGKTMPFENILNLQVRAFFFNSATDYLPYYKNFDLNMDKGATLLDVLNRVKTQNPDFSFPNNNIILKVNDKVTTADTLVTEIVDAMGTELQINPATSYRSNNGLILNDDDFMESFELLAPYATEEDKVYYESLYVTHYASETSNYNRQYIGDAVLVLANRILQNNSEHKEEILTAISDKFNGIRCCEYENNVFKGENHADTIAKLKDMLTLRDTASKCEKFTLRKKDHVLNLETLDEQNIAVYIGDKDSDDILAEIKEKIINAGANFVAFDMSNKLAGQTLMDTHFEMAHTKAGKMLLDALDSGADILVCSLDFDLSIFQNAIVHCEKIMGRDIELKIISTKTLEDLSAVTVTA